MVVPKKSLSRRPLAFIGALFVLALVAFGVRQLNRPPPTASHPAVASAVPVTAATATRQDVPKIVDAIGTVQSIDSVSIQPRVTGTIEKIEFTPGQDGRR